MKIGEVWEYALTGNPEKVVDLGEVRESTVYVMVTYNKAGTIRGILVSLNVAYLGIDDILIPEEESRFSLPYMMCTWADIELDPERIIGDTPETTLHRDHVNSALMLLQSKFTPDSIKIESDALMWESAMAKIDGEYEFFDVPYRRAIISDPFTKRRGKTVSTLAFLGADDFTELYSAKSLYGKLQRQAMKWRQDMLLALQIRENPAIEMAMWNKIKAAKFVRVEGTVYQVLGVDKDVPLVDGVVIKTPYNRGLYLLVRPNNNYYDTVDIWDRDKWVKAAVIRTLVENLPIEDVKVFTPAEVRKIEEGEKRRAERKQKRKQRR